MAAPANTPPDLAERLGIGTDDSMETVRKAVEAAVYVGTLDRRWLEAAVTVIHYDSPGYRGFTTEGRHWLETHTGLKALGLLADLAEQGVRYTKGAAWLSKRHVREAKLEKKETIAPRATAAERALFRATGILATNKTAPAVSAAGTAIG